MSPGDSGSRAASSAASSTFLTRLGSTLLHSDVDGLKGFGLRDLDQLLAGQLEHREEMHDQAGRAHRRVEQRLELHEAAPLLAAAQVMPMCSRTDSSSRLILWLRFSKAWRTTAIQAAFSSSTETSGRRTSSDFSTSVSTQKISR
jgi:hypothetical protein